MVAHIKAQPKDFQGFHPAVHSLDDVLARLAELPEEEIEYSPDEWDEMWAEFERELKEADRANDTAEGRL